jgi:hypothetical protein
MPLEHFDRFFLLAAVGLGLFLAGALNFAFGRSGRRVWLRGAVTLAVCGAVVGALSAVTRPELVARTAGVLLGVLALATVLGSGWFGRQLTSLLSAFRSPALRWGLVAFGGLAVVLLGAIAFERADDAVTDQQMLEMELVLGRPPTRSAENGRAATDRGTKIALKEASAPRDTRSLKQPEEKALRESPFYTHVMRRSGATDDSNCHGWVFTGGKFYLGPDDVELILKENGYQEVHQPLAGDLVVYRQAGGVSHTAVVRYVTEGQPVLVEGKWGTLGVYLHPADKSFYGAEFTFHRSGRSGHLLVGLGGSPGPEMMNQNAE